MTPNAAPSLTSELLSQFVRSGAILGVANGRLLLGIGPFELSATADSTTAFYAPDFFLTDEKPWLHFATTLEVSTQELIEALVGVPSAPRRSVSWGNAPRDRFEKAFEHLQKQISAGILEKGVPFTFERAHVELDTRDVCAALKSVLAYSLDRPVMPYGFWSIGKKSVGMLGCTPELLFRRDGKMIRTMAMAGTRRHEDHDRLPLLEDPKERREHQLVIDSIVEQLKLLGKVCVGTTEVATLPQLSHLKTLIDFHPRADQGNDQVTFDALVQALHPTPALGAFPREAGWSWLKELEAHNDLQRKRYGAPFGAVWKDATGAEQGLAVVAIRNIQWADERVLLCAGCGVIAESELGREWSELEGKIRAVKGILGL